MIAKLLFMKKILPPAFAPTSYQEKPVLLIPISKRKAI